MAAGAVCKLLLRELGAEIVSHVVQMGAVCSKASARPGPGDLATVTRLPVRCFDPDAEAEMVEAVKAAAKDGDSLGGAAEVIAYGVPVGLGSHVHWDRKIDGLLAQALMSIHAVKAVEIGDGIEVAGSAGLGGPRRHRLGPLWCAGHQYPGLQPGWRRGGGYHQWRARCGPLLYETSGHP